MKWMNTEKIEDEHMIYWEKRNDELRNLGIKTNSVGTLPAALQELFPLMEELILYK